MVCAAAIFSCYLRCVLAAQQANNRRREKPQAPWLERGESSRRNESARSPGRRGWRRMGGWRYGPGGAVRRQTGHRGLDCERGRSFPRGSGGDVDRHALVSSLLDAFCFYPRPILLPLSPARLSRDTLSFPPDPVSARTTVT